MRVLVDTNIWIDHLRRKSTRLSELLEEGEVLVHPFIIGELALGEFKHRELILEHLKEMPKCQRITTSELFALIKKHRLNGRGIGLIDTFLLGSALLTKDCLLWSRDRRLQAAARQSGVAFDP